MTDTSPNTQPITLTAEENGYLQTEMVHFRSQGNVDEKPVEASLAYNILQKCDQAVITGTSVVIFTLNENRFLQSRLADIVEMGYDLWKHEELQVIKDIKFALEAAIQTE